MYPTLYHVFYDWFGLDWTWMKMLNSFGFFVAIAFIAANYTLTLEMKRKEKQGLLIGGKRKVVTGGAPNMWDIFSGSLLMFVVGWKLTFLIVNASQLFVSGVSPQSIIFSSQGYVPLGLLLAVLYALYQYNKEKKKQLDKPVIKEESYSVAEYTGTITFLAAVGGFIGAKLFHLFENPDELKEFFAHPSLNGFIAGLTVYGGLIVGSVVVLTWAKMKKMPMLVLSDAATPGMMLAYGIGRMGCHVSGDGDWGVVNSAPKPSYLSWLPDWAWSYDYPNNVLSEGVPMASGTFEDYGMHLQPGVFPTPLYEIIMA
ncbi:MAG: prolipoprotein diacylglyceryl transferase family protein, partial [Bacteroidota bacterium]